MFHHMGATRIIPHTYRYQMSSSRAKKKRNGGLQLSPGATAVPPGQGYYYFFIFYYGLAAWPSGAASLENDRPLKCNRSHISPAAAVFMTSVDRMPLSSHRLLTRDQRSVWLFYLIDLRKFAERINHVVVCVCHHRHCDTEKAQQIDRSLTPPPQIIDVLSVID